MSIIGAEDEDFENEINDAPGDQWKCFNDIEQLKERPTHLLVFLQHVILQFDPAPLLCYLHVDLFKNLSAKETKKHFVEFCSTFLDKGAVLRVTTPGNVAFELDRNRPDQLSEEQQKRMAEEVQAMQAAEVAKQLEDFRQKRMMGMTLNELELQDVESHYPTDRIPLEMKEKSVAENLLDKMSETQPTIVSDEEKCQSIFSAVASYMKHLGVKTRAADSKKSRVWFEKLGLSTNRLEPPSVSDGGDVSPVGLGGGLTTLEPVSPSDTPTEENLERDSCNKGGHDNKCGCPVFLQTEDKNTLSPAQLTPNTDLLHGSRSDVDLQPPATTPTTAPFNPQLLHPFEGPVLVPEGQSHSPTSPSPQLEEMEPRFLEFEQDPPNWRELASPEALSGLSKKETKRQEVINVSELFATEHAHVRMLSVLQMIFSKPLEREQLLTTIELSTIFPNLDEIIEMHYNFYENLKKQRLEDNFIVKSISTTLLNRFEGTEGEWFQKLTARFCSHQSWALDQIKNRQKKDPRFNSFILEAESKPQCRRLQLKDIIPIEMQRLTKYPLLLENIAKNTEDPAEKERIQQSAECCRKILNHVNEEVKVMENLLSLKEYQRKLDTSGLKPSIELYTEYKNLDLTQRKMLYEGPVTWKVTKEKAIEVQCVLLGDLLVLLQKQDDKMVLKCQSKSNIAVQEGKQMLSPIIKLNSVFLREVATDRKAFYVIFTWDSGAQIYELVAQSVGERKIWTEVIKSAVDDLK
uniref:Rho guanine nucleotide exchange factor (GEF) 1 n=1 Tax=Tetraodon nigroviridis TaxID=99883 RepID=H3CRZ0_TETNG